ncbi:MAG: Hsp20/alpha crystallin family protein [Arenibacter algicola]|nr:Hsp20/alpha crystallin family protein [Arenibacter algicola]
MSDTAKTTKKSQKKTGKKTARSKAATQAVDQTTPDQKTDVMDARAAHPLQTLRDEIDQMFDSMLAGLPAARWRRPTFDMPTFDMTQWREPFRDPFKRFEDTFGALNKMSPRADMKETDTGFVITAEMPGVSEGDIDVSVTERRVTIKAEKKEEKLNDDDDMHISERHYGVIQRTFTLPDTADVDKAKGTFADGVLSIDVPKIPSARGKAKKIPIGT